MQGVRKRLDQTFPARKVTSNSSPANPKLDTSSSAMDKENYDEGSIHQNGTSEIYLTARRGASVCLGEFRKGFAGSSSGPTLGKCGGSLGKKSPNSWLTRCGPRVSKFTPPRPIGAPKFVPPRAVEPKVKDDNSRKSKSTEATGGSISDTISCPILEDAPLEKTADKRKLDLDESSLERKKHRVQEDSEDDVVSCTPLLDITNVGRSIKDRFDKRKGTHCQELTVSQRSFWIDDEEICDILPSDVIEDRISDREQWMEEEHCTVGRLPEIDDTDIEETENGADDMSLPEAMQEIFRACEAEKPHDECQNASYNGTFEFDTVEKVICSPEPMSPEEKRRRILRAVDPLTGGSDIHLRSPGDGGGLCWIPPPGNNKVVESSGIVLKCEGGQENGSSFSPGDAFWDEAFEAVSGILVSNVDKRAPEQNSPGYQKLVDVARGREAAKVDGRLDNQVIQVKEVEMFSKAATQQISVKEKIADKSVLASEHDTRTPNVSAARWYDDFEISPLPVRRLSLSDHENVPNESIDKFINDEVLNVSQTMIPSRSPLVEPSIEVDPSRTSGVPSQLPGSSSASVRGGVEPEKGKTNLADMKSKTQYKVELCKWLPPELCSFFAKKGLTKLYQWQVECLQIDGVLDGRSLVYCASTSAGKSLVAELLMLRRVLSTGKKALLVLPYVTLCSEKATHLQALLQPLGKRVRGFYGTQGGSTLPKDTSVAVCTIEKANSLVNKLLEEGRLSELCIIVIDELHMVGDRDRGYLLELLLTKIRYAACCEEIISDTSTETKTSSSIKWSSVLQIVGMSATMPNVSEVAKWLQAALYQTEFRPVPLEEFMKVGNTIFDKRMEIVRMIRDSADLGGKDPDHIVELCHEVVSEGHSVLVFCSSRKGCETSARHIAKHLPPCTVIKKNTSGPKDGDAAVEELRRCSAGLDPVLADTLPAGVAYHHAGLTAEERDVVETCFKSGVVRVLVATSTLAAGVNLPARRVIFRQPKIGRDFVDTTRYRQMAGRAGRAGIDTKGESILICKPDEAKRIMEMMKQDCKALESCLADDKNGMVRALLEVVAGGIVQSAADVQRYVRCTLLNATQPFEEVVKSAQDSLRWLCYKHFLEWDASAEIYITTPLGRAAFSSSLSPEESLIVFEDLAKARDGFVLASDLHLIYEVTPTYVDLEPDWGVFYQRYMDLSPIDQAVGSRVGVMEAFLLRMAHGAPILQHRNGGRSRGGKGAKGKVSPLVQKSRWKSPSGAQLPVDQLLRICKRFYVALILSYLVQEVPMLEICERFNVQKGAVQGLQESAGKFAGMVAAFCERLGWSDMGSLVDRFQKRVSFGVKSEIVDLTEIPFVKAARARALFKAGLKSIQAVAEATIDELVNALFNDTSRKSEDENSKGGQQWLQVGVVRKIKNAARRIALDRAEESRAAAFSACQALGIQVNAGLALPLIGGIDDEEAKASTEFN
ncbi:hypothetical protein KC19_2G150600 [Ceratodon purpureus]|uniref:DNA-directed DNA polymerase n=1 Tax=Ceratodon purpureus TaxID=3225 RepID=A0A8T0IU31_CERPU|nr:hypothetical protein KC19_2G150600 [Ceratodon purpureus]